MTTGYTLMSLQERGILLVGPGTEVYEGMVVGRERPRRGDGRQPDQGEEADQHPVRLRRRGHPPDARRCSSRSSRRSSSSPTTSASRSPRASVRLRKVILDQTTRGRLRSRARKAN